MKKILVVGGGASGMAAAAFAKTASTEVLLLEKNEKTGKKLYITGKGRCNLTNAADPEEIIANIVSNPRFMYSALYGFTNRDVMALMEENGCPVKVERGNRVFPVSDHSSDVIKAWNRILEKQGVRVQLGSEVSDLIVEDGAVRGVRLSGGEAILSDAVIVCTGGLSYPVTGSTGDGYRFASECGHRVTDCLPSLVPFECSDAFIPELEGLSLRNVRLTIRKKKGKDYSDFGEMLFTKSGISGPLVLTASARLSKELAEEGALNAEIDLKPALSESELDARILRDFSGEMNRSFRNSLGGLLPKKMTGTAVALSGIDPEKKVHDITKEERQGFVRLLKAFPLHITGTRGYSEAVVTRGGVSVREVDPGTMESSLVKNLYFAGEVLDLDACTGGYNLQIAWSTGVLAGRAASGSLD